MAEYQGLTSKNAAELLVRCGENTISKKQSNSALKILSSQFRDTLIMILLAATLLSLIMGEITESITISSIIVINAFMGFFQEFRTEKTLEKLSDLAAPAAWVVRDGKRTRIDTRKIVPDDLVELTAGDRVPADGVLLSCTGITCDESMLSGESAGVEKSAAKAFESAADTNTVYMGTMVTRGSGKMRVRHTGKDTEMGKIAGMLGSIKSQPTPLQIRLTQLSKYIGIGCLAICGIVAITGILRGEPPFDMLLTGISLAVAAVPEGLPAIVTVSLALSVNRMVKRRALIRRLHAVETLGCANIICSDKTGTLTENRMTVTKLYIHDEVIDVSGSGIDTHGEFTASGKKTSPQANRTLSKLLTIASLCNNAQITTKRSRGFGKLIQAHTTAEVSGEPTETALQIVAAKGKIADMLSQIKRCKEIPFDSTRKRMSVLVNTDNGYELFVKGAPDLLLDKCTHILTASGVVRLDTRTRHKILYRNNSMAESALRVLALAYRNAENESDTKEDNLIFAGLAGLLDPPRKEAYDAVIKCRRAGIRPIMVTGDHAITARAIACKLSICTPESKIVTASELDSMSEDALADSLDDISVFARVTPAHKLRIVRALKKRNNIVAMTGDGVNDAPAVKESDIGVAMGVTGTDVTKEAASVILMDDNFATLVSAVEEGRVIYSNIRKFIRYLLSCNIGEVVTMFFAMLIGLPIPLIPIQILLINLITDSLPALSLGLEPAEPDIMQNPPRGRDESVFSRGLAGTIIIRGLLIGVTTLAAFFTLYKSTGSIGTGRTAALMTLVITQLIHVFECKSETRGLLSINIFNNIPLIISVLISLGAIFAGIYNPFLAGLFKTVPLSASQIYVIVAYCAAVPIINEIILHFRRSKHHSSSLNAIRNF